MEPGGVLVHTTGMVAHHREEPQGRGLRGFTEVFGYTRAAVRLVWETSRTLTLLFVILTLVGGLLPAAAASGASTKAVPRATPLFTVIGMSDNAAAMH